MTHSYFDGMTAEQMVAVVKRLDQAYGYRMPGWNGEIATLQLNADDWQGVIETVNGWTEEGYDDTLRLAAECAVDCMSEGYNPEVVMVDTIIDEALQEYGLFHPPADANFTVHPVMRRIKGRLPQNAHSILRFFCGADPRIRGRIR